jgi:hypothetical protein
MAEVSSTLPFPSLTAIPAFLALLGYAVSYLQNDTLLNSRNGMILIINPFNRQVCGNRNICPSEVIRFVEKNSIS